MRKGYGPSVIKVEFQQLITQAAVAGSRQTQLVPTSMGSLGTMYTSYELYKFTKLKYRILTNVDGTTGSIATVAYYPDVNVTAPASLPAALENPDCIVRVTTQTTPTEWHDVPKERLRGQLAWYKCQPDASSSDFEVQGLLQTYTNSATEAVIVLVRGVCAFRNLVDSGTALNRLKAIARQQVLEELADSDEDVPTLPETKTLKKIKSSSMVNAVAKTTVRGKESKP